MNITINDLKTHHTEKPYTFIIQLINDLWEDWMYGHRQATDTEIDEVNIIDVGYFREWLDQEGLIAFLLYLPESDSLMQEIIKFCVNETK